MTTRQDRTAGPSIKELLEALTEEERRTTAQAAPPVPRHAVNSEPPHRHVTGAPMHTMHSSTHPAHAAFATLAAQAAMHASSISQPATNIEFEQGGGADIGSHERGHNGAQVPRRAPSAPPPSDPHDNGEPSFDEYHALAASPSHLHVDRERAHKLVQSHVRMPFIARHAFAAAGALAVILPSALYLTAPVLDRMHTASENSQPIAIAQRGVVVTSVATATTAPSHAAVSSAPAANEAPSVKRFATASLGSLDRYAPVPGPGVPKPTPVPHTIGATQSGDTAALLTTPTQGTPEPLSAEASRSMTAERAASLLARGRELLENRDVTAARHYFERAAEGGSAQAALEAARTFDPTEIKQAGLIGLKADSARAEAYYRQAEAGGIAAARAMLARLATP